MKLLKRNVSHIVMVATLVVVSGPAYASWWTFVHCWGGTPDPHHNGQPPLLEMGADVRQCHGAEQDRGQCDGSNPIEDFDETFTEFSVSCYAWLNGATKCIATVECNPGIDPWDVIVCSSINGDAFAGYDHDGNRGYVLCTGENGTKAYEC